MPHATLRNNAALHRYELVDAGQVVAFAEYKSAPDAITLVHTEVSPEHGGKGYGSALAKQVLDEIQEQHQTVVPACEFMAAYIVKHAQYAGLVKPAA